MQTFTTSTLSPLAVFDVFRKMFGAPCAILESMTFDESNKMSIIAATPIQEVVTQEDSFRHIQEAISKAKELPKDFRFRGGLIGYFNFEVVEEIESCLAQKTKTDHAIFYEFRHYALFDHNAKTVTFIDTEDETDFSYILDEACQKKAFVFDSEKLKNTEPGFENLESELTQDEFEKKVAIAKQKILDGEIFQVIVSNEFQKKTDKDGIEFYRLLREVEPTSHMYFLDFGDKGQVVGASPEILGSKQGDAVCYRPIAGTRYRGKTTEEDLRIEAEMKADPKENAEHNMLIDLGRNDLGRVCVPGSIKVEKEKYGKKFSSVMHMVSDITGTTRKDVSSLDFFKAIFPAGTLTGAPKIRAMQIIRDLEKVDRGLYGGAVGYFSADGNMEFAIAIRSFFLQNGVACFRVGAGIVQDSEAKKEWLEVHNKAKTLAKIFNVKF